jgi:hypothetical protein
MSANPIDSTQQPSPYEMIEGFKVNPKWNADLVPVTPAWVRDKVVLPRKLQYATFARELSYHYVPEIYETGRRYVSSQKWPFAKAHGHGPVLIGPPGTSKTWAAAAMLNEITLRYSEHYDISTAWISTFWTLPLILDARHFKNEDKFYYLRNKAHDAEIIVVDDLLAAGDVEGGRNFIWSLYEYRNQHQKPTITTVTSKAKDQDDVWRSIEKIFGKFFAVKLKETSAEHITFVL